MTTHSAFNLNNIHLSLNHKTDTLTAKYGDTVREYKLAEFADDYDAPLADVSLVSLAFSARVKFATAALVA